jgi:hypothetical protein
MLPSRGAIKNTSLVLLVAILVALPAFGGRRSGVSSGRKSVHVGGHYRKNGSYVRPHYRAAPGFGTHRSSSSSARLRNYRPHTQPHRHSYSTRSHRGVRSSGNEAERARKRSPAARAAFQREHPCPSNGSRSGRCPGYVVDHVEALACGGADTPSNMQWQTVAEARAKDKIERHGCR